MNRLPKPSRGGACAVIQPAGLRYASTGIFTLFALAGLMASVAFGDAAAPTSQPVASSLPLATSQPATTKSSAFDGSTDDFTLSAPPSGEGGSELMLFNDLPVIVAAGRRVQTQKEATASVSVITADDIDIFGYRSLADLLRNQRSFYLDTDGLNWFAGVRGFDRQGEWNARLLVLVDDRPTREDIFGQTHLDLDFVVPIEAVKQVEVVRGPGSALYGSGADFGVINVVTKDGADVNGVQVKLEGGSQETQRASILYGQTLPGGWDVLACFSGYTTQGDKDIIYDGVSGRDNDFGHIRNFGYEDVDAAFVKARNGEFTFEYDVESRDEANRAATYLASFYDPGNMHEDRTNVTARFDHEIADGQSIHAMVFYSRYGYSQQWFYPPDGVVPAYQYVTTASDAWVGEEIHYDWQVSKAFHLLAGAEGNQALYTVQDDHDQIQGQVLNIPASFNSWGVFAEGTQKISDQLSLTAGLREDYVQRVGDSLSPRAAIVIDPTKEDTIKVLYGRAFRVPNLYELLYSAPGYNDPNPNLKPEVLDTYEVVWERQFQSGWRTTLDGYVWRMHNAMEDVTLADGAVQTQNGPSVWAHGIEAEIDKRWTTGANLRAYGSYTRAEHDEVEQTESPQWIFGVAAAIPVFNNRTFLSIDSQIVGPQKSDLQQYTDATYITNVIFTSRDFWKGWNFQVGVYDLFANHARFPRGGPFNQIQPTLNWPDTSFLVSLTCKF